MTAPLPRDSIISSSSAVPLRGCHEISFANTATATSEIPLLVAYTLPSGVIKTTRGFLTSEGNMKARCYVNEEGKWSWEAKNTEGRCIGTGAFTVIDSSYPGKARVSARDPRQLQYDNGKWYLHFGDNAYRFLSQDETQWKAYIDQAAQAGFNRIRTWISPSSDSLFLVGRKHLNLRTWDAIDERLVYALQRHPEIQFELIWFGEDKEELERFGNGDTSSHLAFRYAIERFSPLPNTQWSAGSGFDTEDPSLESAIKMAGEGFLGHQQWGALVTATGRRFDPSLFPDQRWLSLLSIRSLGQVTGRDILSERSKARKPVILAEDRGEYVQPPRFPRYYFRRLFWGTLLSGGLPAYSGLETSKPTNRNGDGIEGYYDACNGGRLRHGAQDLHKIKKFFAETGISLEGWIPCDALSGDEPLLVKSMRSEDSTECIAYIANPETYAGHNPNRYEGIHSDQLSDVSQTFTTFTLELPFSTGEGKWFNPSTGEWKGKVEITKNSTTLLTPEPGDWVVWVKRS